MFPYARTCIPGCQHPVMVDAVPAQYKHTLFHGRVSMAFPAPTMSMRLPRLGDLSDSKLRCQDQERSAAWYMAYGTPFSDYLSFVIIHLGVSSETLPDPVVRRSLGLRGACVESQTGLEWRCAPKDCSPGGYTHVEIITTGQFAIVNALMLSGGASRSHYHDHDAHIKKGACSKREKACFFCHGPEGQTP